jgi:hypothetical protein
MTNLVAKCLGENRQDELPAIVWTANGVMAIMGIVGAIALAAVSPLLTYSLLKIPHNLQQETLRSLFLLSIAVPLVISTAGFRGILEAQQKFGLLNIVKIPMGVATFLAPVAVLPFTNSLTALIGALVFARVAFLVACIGLALREMPALRHQFAFDKALLRPLFTFGGWMTVSNVVSPMMVYVDRFLIGSILSITAVAYYATPYEVATKLLDRSGSVGRCHVSRVFDSHGGGPASVAQCLYRRATKYAGLFLFPLSFVSIVFSQDLLQVWLGHEFAVHSTRVLQILSLGVLANGLGSHPLCLDSRNWPRRHNRKAAPRGTAVLPGRGVVSDSALRDRRHRGCVAGARRCRLHSFVLCSRIDAMGVAASGLVACLRCDWHGRGCGRDLRRCSADYQLSLFVAVCGLALFGLVVWRLALSGEERFAVHRAIWGVSGEEV